MKKDNGRFCLRLYTALLLAAALTFGGWLIFNSTADRSGWTETAQGLRYLDFYGRSVTGWQTIEGSLHYFEPDGTPASGWLELEGQSYCFGQNGQLCTGWVDGRYLNSKGKPASGWVEDAGDLYYLAEGGFPLTGWQEIEGKSYCFRDNGVMVTGWAEFSGQRYYFDDSGLRVTGWHKIDGCRYLFDESYAMVTGWVQQGEYSYYLHPEGNAAVGPTEIDGRLYHFTPTGIRVILVNPWNYLPEDHTVDLVYISGRHYLDAVCVEALAQMLADCAAAGCDPALVSSYRTWEYQEYLYERRTQLWMQEGYGREEAEKKAGTSVAIPDTSEHQLGLAVDIVDSAYTRLEADQANTATQQWLMAHCWEYGFILRYPEGSTDITGIIYEPWHYRYVGTEVSIPLKELGITLEEYLGAVQNP